MLNNFEYVGNELVRGNCRDMIGDARQEFQMRAKSDVNYRIIRNILNSSQGVKHGNYYDAMSQRQILVEEKNVERLREAIFELTKHDGINSTASVKFFSRTLPIMEIPQALSNPIAILRLPSAVAFKKERTWRIVDKKLLESFRGISNFACRQMNIALGGNDTLHNTKISVMIKPFRCADNLTAEQSSDLRSGEVGADLLVKFHLQICIGEQYRAMFADIIEKASAKMNGVVYRTQYNEFSNFYLGDSAWMMHDNFVYRIDDWSEAMDLAAGDVRHVIWGDDGPEFNRGTEVAIENERSYLQIIGSDEMLMWYDLICRYIPTRILDDEEEYTRFLCAFDRKAECVAREMAKTTKYASTFEARWATRKQNNDFRYYSALTQIHHGYHDGVVSEFAGEFDRFIRRSIYAKLVAANGRLNHMDTAKLISYTLDGRYYCDGRGVARTWYEYVPKFKIGHPNMAQKWITLSSDPRAITIDEIAKFTGHLCAIISGEDEVEKKAPGAKFIENLRYLIIDMGNMPRINSTMCALSRYVSESGISSMMDIDNHVIGMMNGVLDLDLHSDNPRPRLCVDFPRYIVTKSTNANYIPYNPENRWVKKWHEIYRGIYYEDDVCEYNWFRLSTYVDAVATIITTLMVIARGSNGKSVSMDNPMHVLGDYCCKVSTSLLTHSHRGNNADTDLMQVKGKRGIFVSETDDREPLSSSRLKTITERVKTGRHQYGEMENFKAQPTTNVYSNFPLRVDDDDEGTWRRYELYRAKRRFIPNPDPNNKFECKADRSYETLAEDNQDAADALFSILVHYRVRLKVEYGDDINQVPRPTIVRETLSYRNSQDKVSMFISTKLVRFMNVPSSYRYDASTHAQLELEYGDTRISPYIAIEQLVDTYNAWHKRVEGKENIKSKDDIVRRICEHKSLEKYIQNDFGVETSTDGFLLGFRLIPPNGSKLHGETFV